MNVRQELQKVRADYEAKDTFFLMVCLKAMGIPAAEVDDMDRAEMLDRLMALEEHAAFH